MQKQTPTTQDEARQYAIDWQNWASDTTMSMLEYAEWTNEMQALAEKFDLLEEFKDNGII